MLSPVCRRRQLTACSGYTYAPLVETSPATLANVVATNLLVRAFAALKELATHSRAPQGTLLCCRAAFLVMKAQPAGGCVINMEGAGSDGAPPACAAMTAVKLILFRPGNATVKYAAYGATKAALPQLTKSLQKELGDASVVVHTLSPGMVQTELISCGKDAFGAGGRFFVNALSEPPEVAAAIIVPQLLALAGEPRGGGAPSRRLAVLTPLVAAQKLARRVLLQENKGRYYAE